MRNHGRLSLCPAGQQTNEDRTRTLQGWLDATVDLLQPRVYFALGQIGFRAVVDLARERGWHSGRLPKFAHAAHLELAGDRHLLASYHVSQQNTFTGRLTEEMLDDVLQRARRLLDS